MPFEAPLVVTYGSRLSASTPWAMVSEPAGPAAAGAVVAAGAGCVVAAAAGGVVGLTAGATVAAAAGGLVWAGAGAGVGWAGAAVEHAASTPPAALRPSSSSASRRVSRWRFMVGP